MNCPACEKVTLVMTTRQDIEIDYCPTCRGVWLDRGELDKIVARARGGQRLGNDDDDDDEDDDDQRGLPRGAGRRRSWWTELFD